MKLHTTNFAEVREPRGGSIALVHNLALKPSA